MDNLTFHDNAFCKGKIIHIQNRIIHSTCDNYAVPL